MALPSLDRRRYHPWLPSLGPFQLGDTHFHPLHADRPTILSHKQSRQVRAFGPRSTSRVRAEHRRAARAGRPAGPRRCPEAPGSANRHGSSRIDRGKAPRPSFSPHSSIESGRLHLLTPPPRAWPRTSINPPRTRRRSPRPQRSSRRPADRRVASRARDAPRRGGDRAPASPADLQSTRVGTANTAGSAHTVSRWPSITNQRLRPRPPRPLFSVRRHRSQVVIMISRASAVIGGTSGPLTRYQATCPRTGRARYRHATGGFHP